MFGLSVREVVCVCCVQSLGSFRAQIGVDCPQTGVDWVELGSFGQYTPVFGRIYPGVYFSIHHHYRCGNACELSNLQWSSVSSFFFYNKKNIY
jgi:hypothetical protein